MGRRATLYYLVMSLLFGDESDIARQSLSLIQDDIDEAIIPGVIGSYGMGFRNQNGEELLNFMINFNATLYLITCVNIAQLGKGLILGLKTQYMPKLTMSFVKVDR